MEEDDISDEYKCQICLDLLVEPTTTVCGHSFCKNCLIQFLESNSEQKCPLCRSPIYQLIENINKNISLENIIKNLFPIKYEQRMKLIKDSNSISNNDNNNHNNEIIHNVPTLIINNFFAWPGLIKEIEIYESDLTNFQTKQNLEIINNAMRNDNILNIIPSNNINIQNENNLKCNLYQILNVTSNNLKRIYKIKILCIKRLIFLSFNDTQMKSSNCRIINDKSINEMKIKEEIFEKIKKINDCHREILKFCPYVVTNFLEVNYGKIPFLPINANSEENIKKIELASFYFTGILNIQNKIDYLYSDDLLERVNLLLNEYEKNVKLKENPSLPYVMYNIHKVKFNSEKNGNFVYYFIAFCVLICVLIKLNVIEVNKRY